MALDTPEMLSAIVGWAYTAAWTVSFYPQLARNARRRTTRGVSVDFVVLNLAGMLAYAGHNAALLWDPRVRAQYAARHPARPAPAVQLNDAAFALHGAAFSLLLYSQFCCPRLWRFAPPCRGSGSRSSRSSCPPRSSPWVVGLVRTCAVAIALAVLAVLAAPPALPRWEWLDVIYLLGHIKSFLTLLKYTPQAWLNFRRQSTQGLAVLPFTLDLVGGLLSLLQLTIDAVAVPGGGGGLAAAIGGNPAKFALANVTILFDLVFLLQVLYLYRDAPATDKAEVDETGPLLAAFRADPDLP